MAENVALHKYIRHRDNQPWHFFAKDKYLSFNEIRKFDGFFELNFLFGKLLQVR